MLHTDDAGALYSRQADVAEHISPAKFLWFRRMPGPLAGFLIVTIGIYRKGWLVYLASLILLGHRRYQEMPWRSVDAVVVCYLVFPVVFAFGAQFFQGASGRYKVLIEAVAWGRWREVLSLADAVGGHVPPEEIAFQKAKAFAGLGMLERGLEVVKPFDGAEKVPGWMYDSRLAEVYSAAKRQDDAAA